MAFTDKLSGAVVPLATPGASLLARPSGRGASAVRVLGTVYGARTMDAITHVLNAIEQGSPHAAEQLLSLDVAELRKLAAQKLAHEKPGQTLQATALRPALLSGASGERPAVRA